MHIKQSPLFRYHYITNPLWLWLSCKQTWVKKRSIRTLSSQGLSPSCSRNRSWSAGRPLHGPAPVALEPAWSLSDAHCTHAAGWSASLTPRASLNTQTHAVWPIESALLDQPGKKGIIHIVRGSFEITFYMNETDVRLWWSWPSKFYQCIHQSHCFLSVTSFQDSWNFMVTWKYHKSSCADGWTDNPNP